MVAPCIDKSRQSRCRTHRAYCGALLAYTPDTSSRLHIVSTSTSLITQRAAAAKLESKACHLEVFRLTASCAAAACAWRCNGEAAPRREISELNASKPMGACRTGCARAEQSGAVRLTDEEIQLALLDSRGLDRISGPGCDDNCAARWW